jgi:hypothetical protein
VTSYDEQLWLPADQPAPRQQPALIVGLAVAVFGVVAGLGFPLGWLWQQLAPNIPVRIVEEGGKLSGIVPESQPEEFAAADGWFAILGLGFGIVVAVAVWLLVRRLRGPIGLVVLALSCLIAAIVAWRFGRDLGYSQYQDALQHATAGMNLSKPSSLRITAAGWWPATLKDWRAQGVLLIPALGAVVMTTLLAGFSRWPSLNPEPEPGPATPWSGQPTPWPGQATE